MNKNIYKITEVAGIFVTLAFGLLSWNLYELSNKNIAGILLGAVNDSVWEMGKSLWIGYILYALLELIALKPNIKQFTVAKFVGLYGIVLSYIAMRSLFSPAFTGENNLIISLLCICLGFFLSYKLAVCDYPLETLFPTSCFMILLLFVLCFSFTAFPPNGVLFQDTETGLCGIVPDYVDVGAILLDKLYG